mmetsp:Transcript_65354/g.188021  ORF Transcript_65354/g.188021 Transcript_65354/m.188021 type:complete len:203 (-) Transcript_65354:119-727(-)
MCSPLVVVEVNDGLKASPLNNTMASSSPRASDSSLSSRMRVTKRAIPPTGSLTRGSTLYTSLKWRIVIRCGGALIPFVAMTAGTPVASAASTPAATAGLKGLARARIGQQSRAPVVFRPAKDSAALQNCSESQSAVQSNRGPVRVSRDPTGQFSTSALSSHASSMGRGIPLASKLRASGSPESSAPAHNMRSRNASKGPADA